MARGPRIQVSIPKVIYDDIKKRKNFNFSRYVTLKYKEDFLDEQGIREQLKILQERLLAISDEKVAKVPYDSKRCPVCEMFFQEDVGIRKKTHVYASLYVCWQCFSFKDQKPAIDNLVKELKDKEADKSE